MVGKSCSRENHGRNAAEIGRFPRLPPGSQTTQSSGEVSARDQLQHVADQTPSEQPTSLYAV